MFSHVPSGTFTLGVSPEELEKLRAMRQTFYTVTGERQVYVRSFWIRTHPVTVGEWLEFLAAVQGRYLDMSVKHAHPGTPVAGVQQIWAKRFARWKGGRLPTATEWEAAARGNDGRPQPWGDEPDERLLGQKRMPRIGRFPGTESPFGVCEMCGWAMDWTSDLIDGKAIVKGNPYNSRSAGHLATEVAYRPHIQPFNVGFRYVMD